MSTKAQALRNVRAAIFAANRSVWVSCCEASLYLRTNAAAVQSHGDVIVHGRKGLFMMHECKRILNGEVAGTGLWEAQVGTASEAQGEAQGEEVPNSSHLLRETSLAKALPRESGARKKTVKQTQ